MKASFSQIISVTPGVFVFECLMGAASSSVRHQLRGKSRCALFLKFFSFSPPSFPYGSQFWQSRWTRTVKINIYIQLFLFRGGKISFFLTMWQTHVSPIRCGSFFPAYLEITASFKKKHLRIPGCDMWLWLLEFSLSYSFQVYFGTSHARIYLVKTFSLHATLFHTVNSNVFFPLNRCPTCSASTAPRGWAPSCARPSWRTLAGWGPSDATWQRTTSWQRRSCKRWGCNFFWGGSSWVLGEAFACTIHFGTLDASLRPGGGVWGCLGSKLWWGGTGIWTRDLLHASQES